jgi:hypothetical protein
MRWKLLLSLAAIAFVVFSAHKAYVGLTNRRPTRMTCAEFLNGHSSARWVILTDCELDLENAIGLESQILKIDKGVYVPVRPVGATGPARILLKTDGADAGTGISDQRDADSLGAATPSDELRLPAVVATVSGLVESSFDAEKKARRALDKVAREGTIRSDYVVIGAGKEPDPGDTFMGIFFLVTTVLVIGLMIRSKRIQAARRAAGLTPPPLPPPPQPPT